MKKVISLVCYCMLVVLGGILNAAEQGMDDSSRTRTGIQSRLSTDLRFCRETLEKSAANEELKVRLRKELQDVEEKIARIPPVDNPVAFRSIFPLNDLHTRIFAVHGALAKATGAPPLTVWTTNRFDFLTPTQKPSAEAESSLFITAMRGETRSATFNLTNATEESMTVTVRIEGLPGGTNPEYIVVHRVEWTDTREMLPVSAALVPAALEGKGYPIVVPAGMTRQVWLNFTPRDVPAGKYQGRVMVGRQNEPTLEIPLQIYVFNETFPETPTLHVGGWDYTNLDFANGLTPKNVEPLIAHLRERYVDTPWATNDVFLPSGASGVGDLQFDADGKIVKEPDTANLDRWLSRWPHARRYAVAMGFTPGSGSANIGALKHGTPAFDKAVGEWIRFYVNHAASKGVKPEQILILLVDETGNHEMDRRTVDWAKPIKDARTGVQIWTDPTHPIPYDALPELWDVVDVICPHRGQSMGNGNAFADFYRKQVKAGRQLEFYSCSAPGFSLDPYSYYRLQAWTCFDMGATGMHFWVSAAGPGWPGKGNSWNEYIIESASLSAVFLGPDSVTTGKHMEAIRESVQDYEYLVMLRERISQVEKNNPSYPTLPKAKILLDKACDRVLNALGASGMACDHKKDRSIADKVVVEVGEMLEELNKPFLDAVKSTLPQELAVELGDGVKMEFVLVPAGSFVMGSDDEDVAEMPAHEVTIVRSFYMGKYEVTQEQWKAVMANHPTMSPWRSVLGPRHPVEQANWNNAQEFMRKLKDKVPGREFRLPTEAEWEYACRAGSKTKYCYGDDDGKLGEYAWYTANSGERTHPVGEKQPNAWGLFDMHGNVWEICQSVYKPYPYRADDGREELEAAGTRVIRGGSYVSGTRYVRSTFRYDYTPGASLFSIGYVGFRVAMTAPSQK